MVAPSPGDYKEAILFLATAGIVVPLFHRLRVSPVLGFLGAGALIGPHGLGQFAGDLPWLRWVTISNVAELGHLAEFGVVFLLFMIGIELSWERLRTLRRLVFGFGSLQVAACAAVLGVVAHRLGLTPSAALIVGVALALSSTAIVVPVLAEGKRLRSPTGRASFAVLLFQDLAVAPVLFTVSVVGSGEGGEIGPAVALAFGQAAVALAALVGLGRLGLRPLFHMVAETRSPELFMAACLLVVLGTGVIAAFAGLSMALGAFIAGLLLAETEYRRAIEAMIDPFKGLLLGVFFVSIGLGLNLGSLVSHLVPILLLTVGLVVLKVALITIAGLFFLHRAVALETALLLGPGGEFAFVLLGSAAALGLVPGDVVQAVLIATTLSMMMIPALARVGAGFRARVERVEHIAEAEPVPPASDTPRVIVAGFGRVGKLVGEMLARHDVPYIALDADPARVAAERAAGRPVYFGDSAQPELLRKCGIDRAPALVVTLDTPSAIEAVVNAARAERHDLTIVARARDARHATALYDLGVDDAVPETIEASLQLSEAVLVDIGVPIGLVIASVHERRDEYRKVLKRSDPAGGRPAAEPAPFHGRRTAGKRA